MGLTQTVHEQPTTFKVINLMNVPQNAEGEWNFLHAKLCLTSILLCENQTTDNSSQFLYKACMILFNEYWHKKEILDQNDLTDLVMMQLMGIQLLRYPHLQSVFNDAFTHKEALHNMILINSDNDDDFLEAYLAEMFQGDDMEGWNLF